MNESVTIHMDAPPERIWDLVSDVTKIGRYSPETFEAEWLDGATGPAVGAKFRGHVKRNGKGPTYWSPCVVTASVPGSEFSFDVVRGDTVMNSWGYRIAPSAGGSDVTEYFRLPSTLPIRVYWFLAGWARGRTNRNGMRATLGAIKAEVERTGD